MVTDSWRWKNVWSVAMLASSLAGAEILEAFYFWGGKRLNQPSSEPAWTQPDQGAPAENSASTSTGSGVRPERHPYGRRGSGVRPERHPTLPASGLSLDCYLWLGNAGHRAGLGHVRWSGGGRLAAASACAPLVHPFKKSVEDQDAGDRKPEADESERRPLTLHRP